MKKTERNKIEKTCEKHRIKLTYDKESFKSRINNVTLNLSNLKLSPIYNDLSKTFRGTSDKDLLAMLIEYSMDFEWIDTKALEKEAEKAKKAEEKAKKAADKEAKLEKARKELAMRTDEEQMNEWEKKMIRDAKGYIDRSQKRNMAAFLEYYPNFEGKFKFNEFSGTSTYKGQIIEPHITTAISLVCENKIGNNNTQWVNELSNMICHKYTYNPIKEALKKLPEWDGIQRVDRFFIQYIGAYDNNLNMEMTKKWFYALFERLFHPGCKFDHMLIAYDEKHGTGKTTLPISLLETLCEYVGNNQEDSGIIALNELGFDKDTVQCLNKAWIAYVDELAKFLKEEPEDVKKFITQTNDNARLSYERLNKNFPRHCVFYGSTNTKEFIKDNTDRYERRWWIIECDGEKHESKAYWDKVLPVETKLQVLAEAYKFYLDNPAYNYNELSEENENALIDVQRGHRTVSKDEILGNKLMTILDFEYSCDEFDTYYQWKNEAKSLWESHQAGRKETIQWYNDEIFFGNSLKNYEKNEEYDKNSSKNYENSSHFLKKIPIIWVRQFIQEELGRCINDDNYISRLFDIKWQKNRNMFYTNGLRGCYVRIL